MLTFLSFTLNRVSDNNLSKFGSSWVNNSDVISFLLPCELMTLYRLLLPI